MALSRNWTVGSTQLDILQRHVEDFYFDLNGASDPTSFSPNIQSVQRADDGTAEWYRITWYTGGSWRTYGRSVTVENRVDTYLKATFLTDGNATTPALGVVDDATEADIGIQDNAPGGNTNYTNSHVGPLRVTGRIVMEMA